VAWRPLSAPVRVAVAGGDGFAPRREAMGRLNVFRRALASWYGPGFWGQHLGCGGILRPGRLGVAHRTLPCGTMLTLRHGGWTVRAAVIDRGPYVGGREFDLTAATKDRLHFGGVGTVLVTR
jgi:rare lipoprotein A (peptidoglycan hydrolase)